jgi:hypothetical protein
VTPIAVAGAGGLTPEFVMRALPLRRDHEQALVRHYHEDRHARHALDLDSLAVLA